MATAPLLSTKAQEFRKWIQPCCTSCSVPPRRNAPTCKSYCILFFSEFGYHYVFYWTKITFFVLVWSWWLELFTPPYPWILLKISKFYAQQNDKELLTRKLFGALLILPFHDVPVLIKLLKILPSSLQNGRCTVSDQVESPKHGFKLNNDFINAVSLNFLKTEEQ